jgi:serine/threonine protein kinase
MAEIYLARAQGIQGFQKYVVLKRILPQYSSDETFIRMFLDEARVAATLDHPNIAHVYDIGQSNGLFFFAMEYLHGEDAGQILSETTKKDQIIPLELALTIVCGVASGLHFAHEQVSSDGTPLRLVHRDISPSNVVVTYDGGVKLLDFGIAKVTTNIHRTETGGLKGKLSYMSPEQCQNAPLDRRSDIFSLGVVLFELTTQTRLFKRNPNMDVIERLMIGDIPAPSSIVPEYPPALEQIVLKALKRDPVERYSTARELQLALEGFASAEGFTLSSAALGDWMERTFGRKPEAWRNLDKELSSEFDLVQELANDVTRSGISPSVARAQGNARTQFFGPRRRWWPIVVGVGLVAGVAGLLLPRVLEPDEPASGLAPTVVVVAEQGVVAREPTTPSPERPARPSDPIPAKIPAQRNVIRPAVRQIDRNQGFSAAFARREPELERCFAKQPAVASGQQLAVRFEVDRTGHVVAADVLPAPVASTELGQCIQSVALGTRFSAQPAPVAFRIPVSARRVASSAKP